MGTVGDRLKLARQNQALSQDDLAAKSGVPKVTISRIENDRYGPPRPGTVRKLAEALNLNPGWLRYGEDAGATLPAGAEVARPYLDQDIKKLAA